MSNWDMNVRALSSEDVAVVEIELVFEDGRYTVRGSAKKHPKDLPNERIGLNLAFSRAFTSLATMLAADASREIEQNCTTHTWMDPARVEQVIGEAQDGIYYTRSH